jgi:catechol 2,3-dioxygenase-like lactoylglutathione lyase family enzyme
MAVKRLDNVAIVGADLDPAIEFFAELGLTLEGRAEISGEWSARVTGLAGNHAEIAMMRAPGGGGVELTRYEYPPAISSDPAVLPPNTLGFSRTMFAVDDIDDTVERLSAKGGELVADIVQYEDVYRLCYMRGPEGIVVGLAQELG